MKKYVLIAIAALAMTFAACDNKGDKTSDKTTSEAARETTKQSVDEDVKPDVVEVKDIETKQIESSYITYINEKYGFSVEVPSGMEQKGESMGEDGTVFSAEENGSDFVLNRIDISCGKQFFDEEYTPEKVKEEFAFWSKGKEITDTVCGDDYYSFIIRGEMLTEMYYHLYKGSTYALVSICFDADHEKQLGGEVAEHVFKSAKFN